MNKLFIIISLCFTSFIFSAEVNEQRKNPLTADEKALIAEIKDLHHQISMKRESLIVLLEKDHPKAAAKMREAISEAKSRHDERVDKRQERRENKERK